MLRQWQDCAQRWNVLNTCFKSSNSIIFQKVIFLRKISFFSPFLSLKVFRLGVFFNCMAIIWGLLWNFQHNEVQLIEISLLEVFQVRFTKMIKFRVFHTNHLSLRISNIFAYLFQGYLWVLFLSLFDFESTDICSGLEILLVVQLQKISICVWTNRRLRIDENWLWWRGIHFYEQIFKWSINSSKDMNAGLDYSGHFIVSQFSILESSNSFFSLQTKFFDSKNSCFIFFIVWLFVYHTVKLLEQWFRC